MFSMDGYARPKGFHLSVAPVSNLIGTYHVEKEQSVLNVKEGILYSCFNIQSKHKINQRESFISLLFSAHILQLFMNIL